MTPLYVDPPHPATLSDEALLATCARSRQRTGGPGGQHRNKVETGSNLRHEPTGIESHAGERRSAVENERVALHRLRITLAIQVRAPVGEGDRRTPLWQSRCDAQGRINCNPDHHDAPALLAEAMDMLWACGLDAKRAALRLCCTQSQLIKLLKDHPAALARVNETRHATGDHPYR